MTQSIAQIARPMPAAADSAVLDDADSGTHVKRILVLDKAWRILDAFSVQRPELTLAQIREACGFPASTTTRLVYNLWDEGLLERRDDLYRIGSRLLSWSEAARRALDAVALLTPILEHLRDVTGESAALYERRGLQRVCVAVVPTHHAVIWQLHVGLTTPLHVGSGGRALLAFSAEAQRALRSHALQAHALQTFTAHTVADDQKLAAALAETRRVGVAISVEELALDVAGVSAPVIDASGEAVASLGVAGPAHRFQPDAIQRYVPVIREAGREASRLMGGRFPIPPSSTTPTTRA
ncbi:MAG TPA: IclR family transcriptional regulator [Nevskiaceae bacterium]|nr:IclR family transcriptional regulator [Nevskiaceae bacterium]